MHETTGIHIYRVSADGKPDYEFKQLDKCPTLEEFYELIDCRLIEIVPVRLRKDYHMVVDEEGLIAKKPINRAASELAGKVIAGTAVVLDGLHLD